MLSLQKKKKKKKKSFLSFHSSSIFHLKRLISILHVKWTGMNERSRSKIWRFEWTYFLNDPEVFLLQLKDLHFNLQSNTFPYRLNEFIPFSPIENILRIHCQFLKTLGNRISQPFILSLKCDHPLLCGFSVLFSTVSLKIGHMFFQLIHRFNIGILKCWSGAVYISKFFPIHKRDGKLGFLKSLDCISKFSPIHWKVWKLRFLSPCLHIWSNDEGGLSVR